jgi:S-DNA-T family DNA segregation ATPase FtsK/SpoIIIE
MTYSLDTLTTGRQAAQSGSPSTGFGRFAVELALLAGALLLAFWLLALLSYSTVDAAWSTSGHGVAVVNRAGRLGAWIADASYYLFGFSVWWLVAIGIRTWLSGLAAWLRHGAAPQAPLEDVTAPHPWLTGRVAFWCGLVLLLGASSVLEWTRLYSFEARLPADSGGALGSMLGPLGLRWLGFTGSGLAAILIGLGGASLAFRFSWGNVAERIGAVLHARLESSRKKREAGQDIAMGQQAAREREVVVSGERVESMEHHPEPVHVEPVVLEVPKSERVAKERQKPLFADMPDSKLPQVDLRVAKVFRFGTRRLDIGVDGENLFNTNYPTAFENTYQFSTGNTALGGTWNNPTAIYTPRYARLNFTVSF